MIARQEVLCEVRECGGEVRECGGESMEVRGWRCVLECAVGIVTVYVVDNLC